MTAFKECPSTRRLAFASKWGCKLDIWTVSSIEDLVDFCINPKPDMCFQNTISKEITIFLASLIYFAWKCRNESLFSGPGSPHEEVSHFNHVVEDFMTFSEASFDAATRPEEFWRPPAEGWWKINTDAAFSNGQAGLAFTVRNWKGELLYLASKCINCDSPLEAELKALVWEAKEAANRNWNNLEWSSNSALVVENITSHEDPTGWDSRCDFIFLQSLFSSYCWKIRWNSRETNGLADCVAKKVLKEDVCFELVNFCFQSLPRDILDVLASDWISSSLGL
nr:uncharacterized protein LOC125421847 [Ziziphus jujuba var. spinosa]